MNEKITALITELATWNGRLSAAIEIGLISIKHSDLQGGVDTLAMVLRDYQEYRDEQYHRIMENTYGQATLEAAQRQTNQQSYNFTLPPSER